MATLAIGAAVIISEDVSTFVVAVVVVIVEYQDVTSVVLGIISVSVSAVAEGDDDNADVGGVCGAPKSKVEEDAKGGDVFGRPEFKEDDVEMVCIDVAALVVLVLVLVIALVLSGHGPKGSCESMDVPWEAIVKVMVCEMMELQGKGEGNCNSPLEEDDDAGNGGSGVGTTDEEVKEADAVKGIGESLAPEIAGGSEVGGGWVSSGFTKEDEEIGSGGGLSWTTTVLTLNTVVVALSVTVMASGSSDAKIETDGGNRSVEKASALPAVSETQITSVASNGGGGGGGIWTVKAVVLAIE